MIPWTKPEIGETEEKYVLEALRSTWISDGKFVDRFQTDLQNFLQVPRAVSVTSGTAALQLAYLTLGLGPGDEIIVPGYTFAAPANMAIAVGATPIFADIDSKSWMISPASIRQLIGPKTRAIVVVHLYGYVCNMPEILSIAREHDLYVIEDNAESLFAKSGEQYAGTRGTIGCLSFQSTKMITTGEGGALLTSSSELGDRAQLIRNHGMRPEKKYWHEVVGHNFRMTNLTAALGVAQMERAEETISRRRRVQELYNHYLEAVPCNRQIAYPDTTPLVWVEALRLPGFNSEKRDRLMQNLREDGVETRPGFISFDRMPLYNSGPLPQSSNLTDTLISLPTFLSITEDEIVKICGCLQKRLKDMGLQ